MTVVSLKRYFEDFSFCKEKFEQWSYTWKIETHLGFYINLIVRTWDRCFWKSARKA